MGSLITWVTFGILCIGGYVGIVCMLHYYRLHSQYEQLYTNLYTHDRKDDIIRTYPKIPSLLKRSQQEGYELRVALRLMAVLTLGLIYCTYSLFADGVLTSTPSAVATIAIATYVTFLYTTDFNPPWFIELCTMATLGSLKDRRARAVKLQREFAVCEDEDEQTKKSSIADLQQMIDDIDEQCKTHEQVLTHARAMQQTEESDH